MKRFLLHVSVKDLWETFHTLGRISVYGEDTFVFNHGSATVPTEQGKTSAKCCLPPTPEFADCCEPHVPGGPCCAA